MSETKVLAKDSSNSKATRIAVTLTVGVWDSLPMEDRRAWCEEGEIRDTPGGRLLFQLFQQMGAFQ